LRIIRKPFDLRLLSGTGDRQFGSTAAFAGLKDGIGHNVLALIRPIPGDVCTSATSHEVLV
jgi:hypothetical protein